MTNLLNHSDAQKTRSRRGFSHAGFSVGIVLGLSVATFYVIHLHQNHQAKNARLHDLALNDTVLLIEEAMQHLSSDYISEIAPEVLAEAALDGMFSTLDKHSKYLNESTYQELLEQTDGEYLGIGIEAEEQNGRLKIVSLVAESPAAQIGLLIGDQITAVNGQSVLNRSYLELLKQARENLNQSIALSIRRYTPGTDTPGSGTPGSGTEDFEVQLTQSFIPIESVSSVFLPLSIQDTQPETSGSPSTHNNTPSGIAYLRITHFNEHTATDLALALDALKNNEQTPTGIVLDLRNNPGGLLNAAVEVSDLFLHAGTIVSANGRAADADFKYQAQAGERFKDVPLVILINHATASAAEIVAAALKEQDRATLIGENSYGKGMVQTIIPLQSGALKLTTSRYYTPSGLSINEQGIRPHIKIEDSAMMMALQELQSSNRQQLPFHLAIKDPALLRAWQHIDRANSRDQLAMDMATDIAKDTPESP